ncbi:MAG TPA: ankyrin repeat domain-containing protein [Thermoanaerobaculia bacterium]
MNELFEAISRGDAAKVQSILDRDPAQISSTENNTTPLLMALYCGQKHVADVLAGRGARIGFPEACAMGDLDRVRSMAEKDLSLIDTRSPDGFPPLGLAIFFRHPQIAKLLIERGADVNSVSTNKQHVAPVHAAAAVGDVAMMKLLLERGANANAKQESDYTPLHEAAGRGNTEMAQLLLAHGADLHAKASDGSTPADTAVKRGQPAFAEWIRTVT